MSGAPAPSPAPASLETLIPNPLTLEDTKTNLLIYRRMAIATPAFDTATRSAPGYKGGYAGMKHEIPVAPGTTQQDIYNVLGSSWRERVDPCEGFDVMILEYDRVLLRYNYLLPPIAREDPVGAL